MKFFADENVAKSIVHWLRSLNGDVLYAGDAAPGRADLAWLQSAEAEQRLILTADKDFGEMVFREGRTSHGIILMRIEHLPVSQRLTRLQAV